MSTRPATTHQRSTLIQGHAALLAIVFVVSQIGSYVHAAFEDHARCPEHGELIHVDELPRTSAGPVATSEHDALLDASAGANDHAHEHCYLCPVSRDRTAPAAQADHGVSAEMPAVVTLAPEAVAAPGGRATYTIAPKTSPPA